MPRAKKFADPTTPTDGAAAPAKAFLFLRHDQILADPHNARKTIDPVQLAELAETLATHGLLQAPVVSGRTVGVLAADAPDDVRTHYKLVAGERRWRAWGLLIADGRWPADHEEPCLLNSSDDDGAMEAALIENLQRVDLNHMEAGEAFATLAARFHLSNKDIAARIGRTAEYVQQHRRLTKLGDSEREADPGGEMTLDAARQALARPGLDTLSPAQRTILIEALHHIATRPAKTAIYESPKAECFWTAGDDGDFEQLRNLRMLDFTPSDYRTHRAYVSHGYRLQDLTKRPPTRRSGLCAPIRCATLNTSPRRTVRITLRRGSTGRSTSRPRPPWPLRRTLHAPPPPRRFRRKAPPLRPAPRARRRR